MIKAFRVLLSRRFIIYLNLLLLFFFIQSCTKIQLQNVAVEMSYNNNSIIASKFLTLPPSANPLVKRIAHAMEIQNNKKEFLQNFVTNEGYAIWDKIIIKESNRQIVAQIIAGSTANTPNTGDSAVIIPLALANSSRVNAYLVAFFSDSLVIKLFRSRDYANYGFATNVSGDSLRAENIALQTMLLDKLVFGYDEFNILDDRLFAKLKTNNGQTPLSRKIKLTGADTTNANVLQYYTTTICITYSHQENYFNPFNVSCPPGLACNWTQTVYTTTCNSSTTFGDNDYYGGGTTGGNGTTGGGTAGAGTGSGGSNGGNTGGGYVGNGPTGWNPIPIMLDPCDKVIAMFSNPLIKSKYVTIRSEAGGAFETGFNYGASGIGNYFSGQNQPKHSVEILLPFTGVLGTVHCHDQGSLHIFAPQDIRNIYTATVNNLANPSKCIFGVVSPLGVTYLLTIQDLDAYQSFCANFIEGETNDFQDSKFDDYVKKSTQSGNLTEKKFLQFIRDKGAGFSLIRANADFTSFTELKLINNEVIPIPCN
jgi:uncharacterized membrane protein YgcG